MSLLEQQREGVAGTVETVPEPAAAPIEKIERHIAERLSTLERINKRFEAFIDALPYGLKTKAEQSFDTPIDYAGIRGRLHELDRKKDEIKSLRTVHLKNLQELEGYILALSMDKDNDANQMAVILEKGRAIAGALNDLEEEDHKRALEKNKLLPELKKTAFAEGKVESETELFNRRMELGEEEDRLIGRFGIGRLFNKQRLEEIRAELMKLDRIYYKDLTDASYKEHHISGTYQTESAGEAVLVAASKQIVAYSERMPFSEVSPKLECDAALLESLTDAYLRHVVFRRWDRTQRVTRITKKDLAQGCEILKKFFELSEKDASYDEFQKLNASVNELHPFIRDRVQKYQRESPYRSFKDAIKWLNRLPELLWRSGVITRNETLAKPLERTFAWPARESVRQNLAESHRMIEGFEEFASEIDLATWEIVKKDKHIREIFGPFLAIEETLIREKLRSRLLTARHGFNANTIAYKLFRLRDKDAAPYLAIAALLMRTSMGSRPFIAENNAEERSELEQYTHLFSPADLVALRAKQMSALMKINEVIRAHPDTYHERVIYSENGSKENPVYAELMLAGENLLADLLKEGTEKEKRFALAVVQQMPERIHGLADELSTLLTGGHPLDEVTFHTLAKRVETQKDLKALALLCAANSSLENRSAYIIRDIGIYWEDVSRGQDREDIERIRTGLHPLIANNTLSTSADIRFQAYLAARNLELPLTPKPSDIVFFLKEYPAISGSGFECNLIAGLITPDMRFSPDERNYIINALVNLLDPHYLKGIRLLCERLLENDGVLNKDLACLYRLSKEHDFENELKWDEPPTENNWYLYLSRYIRIEEEIIRPGKMKAKQIKSYFSNVHPEHRNRCLEEYRKGWRAFLAGTADDNNVPFKATSQLIRTANGAGDLTYIEALGDLVNRAEEVFRLKRTVSRTKEAVRTGLLRCEERFEKEGWGESEKAAFAVVSCDILAAAPSLYSDFLEVFGTMSPKEFQMFAKELFPLYHAVLIVLQESSDGRPSYKPRTLVALRDLLRSLEMSGINADERTKRVNDHKELLMSRLREGFKTRFRLLKIPETLDREHMRSVQNAVRYIGNMNDKTADREALVSFYLGLMINDEWKSFREGKKIDPALYFDGQALHSVAHILREKNEKPLVTANILRIAEDKMGAFQAVLQEETSGSMTGNVQTIDIRLGTMERVVRDLADPDLYETALERTMLQLLTAEGKHVGTVLAKSYGEATGKKVAFSEHERNIQAALCKLHSTDRLTPDLVKKTQDGSQGLVLITNLIRRFDEERVTEEVKKVQGLLTPSADIIAVFNRIGEEFTQQSGALALSHDLAYLENLVVKNRHKLQEGEVKLLEDYLAAIRDQMKKLEAVLAKIREYFEQLRRSSHVLKNPRLADRVAELQKVLYSEDEIVSVNTTLTNDLNLIIENMRQCLGCLRKEANNDTNLTFGDPNKFFLMSQKDKTAGSVADEIMFFVPTAGEDGTERMSFVMDRVYGQKSPDILIAHLKTILKKFRVLKKIAPEASISITVTKDALDSVGLPSSVALRRIKDECRAEKLEEGKVTVTIPESTLGDNYIEFGVAEDCRKAGPREVSAITLF